MHTCILSHRLTRSWRLCPRRVNAGNKITPSMHHPQSWNVTTSVVGFFLKKRSHMQKSRTQWERIRRSRSVFALTVVCVLEDSFCRGASHLACAGIAHIVCGQFPALNRLVGLVVKVSASRAEDPGFESCWRWDFYV